ncbi:unnamed protein product [Parnassius apollo]|uniref:(apollo) hypothetical protein n=1 Tax=Parnassius apollo TaxID=110799 RepID=A0A8S3X6R8_PARAO|nr:unnamed protein product [Parnassius apollo]
MICEEVRVSVSARFISFKMTERQAHSLLSVLELHARVLKGYAWRTESDIYDAWIHERRIDLSAQVDDLTRWFATDLRHIMLCNANLSTMVGHLIVLLLTKRLSSSMVAGLHASKKDHEDIHSFLVRYVFMTALTPDEQALAERLLDDVAREPEKI